MNAGVAIVIAGNGKPTISLLGDFARAIHARRQALLPTGNGPVANMAIVRRDGLPTLYFVNVVRRAFDLSAAEALSFQQPIVNGDGTPVDYMLGRWRVWTS